MKKALKDFLRNKLLLQAEEAKHQGMYKLADNINSSLTSYAEDKDESYDYGEMQDDVQKGLWNLATCVIKYHDVESVDSQRLDEVIDDFCTKFIEEIETALDVDNSKVGPLESKTIGEKE